MKIKTLLNLSEATIELDTTDYDNKLFQDFLKRNDIKSKVINPKGPGGGWPVIEYSGTKRALEQMVHQFFGDDDLKDEIQENSSYRDPSWKKGRCYNYNVTCKNNVTGNAKYCNDCVKANAHEFLKKNNLQSSSSKNESVEEKIISTYLKGKDSATLKKQEDNSIYVTYNLTGSRAGAGLKAEFKNKNEAMKWLESNGWELDELYEGTTTSIQKKILFNVPKYFSKNWKSKLQSMNNIKKLAEVYVDQKDLHTVTKVTVDGDNIVFNLAKDIIPTIKDVSSMLSQFKKFALSGNITEAVTSNVDEDIADLENIQNEMLELLSQAKNIIKSYRSAYSRADAYWLTAVKKNLTSGGSMTNFNDTLKEIKDPGNHE